jgi:hypothetical protein
VGVAVGTPPLGAGDPVAVGVGLGVAGDGVPDPGGVG